MRKKKAIHYGARKKPDYTRKQSYRFSRRALLVGSTGGCGRSQQRDNRCVAQGADGAQRRRANIRIFVFQFGDSRSQSRPVAPVGQCAEQGRLDRRGDLSQGFGQDLRRLGTGRPPGQPDRVGPSR